jgi:DinB superfamily
MESKELEKLKYPIGLFSAPETITEEDLQGYISDIEKLPANLKNLVSDFSEEQLNTVYRPDGWTVRQVIHHVADSHMNAYIRFKLALTEDTPTIKPYYEDKWAELGDSKKTSAAVSLKLLEYLHERWVNLLKSMSKKDFEKSFFHPEHGKEFSLDEITAMYSWHGKHHLAHIEELKKRKAW